MRYKDENTANKGHINRLLLAAGAICGLLLIAKLLIIGSFVLASLLILSPLIFLAFLLFLRKPLLAFFFLYGVIFLISGIRRYVALPLPAGVFVDIFVGFTFLLIFLNSYWGEKKQIVKIPPLFYLTFLWLAYCIVEIINPQSNIGNWATTVRGTAGYIVLLPLLVFLICNKFKYLKGFLVFWAFLVLLAVLKAFIQKTIGFDAAENYWLFTLGAAKTHIIYSGIRYFSFFSDAANFGCHMGLAMVVFSIMAIYERSIKLKIFYAIVVVAATYGMMISGTRAAIAIPFVGLACFVVLVRQWKLIIAGSALLVFAFLIFNFTSIGSSNASVRRMRTAFRFEKDASFNVRKTNQEKIKRIMVHYPFGLGIGSAKHNTEQGGILYGIATDSSFIFIWVETGIVGAILYAIVLFTIWGYGVYEVMFKLKHPLLRGTIIAFIAGLAGIIVAGYANEVFHQLPTGPTLYILMAFIMLSPQFDKELLQDNG